MSLFPVDLPFPRTICPELFKSFPTLNSAVSVESKFQIPKKPSLLRLPLIRPKPLKEDSDEIFTEELFISTGFSEVPSVTIASLKFVGPVHSVSV